MSQGPVRGIIRFGPFEVEPQARVLRKGATRIRLQEQPFRVLLALLERPWEAVTREELQEEIWKGESFSDLDHRLNIAVNKIREALRDSSEAPRYVETLPRRGYRFIGAVEGTVMPVVDPLPPGESVRRLGWVLIACIVIALGGVVAGAVSLYWTSPPPRLEWRRLTNDTSAKYAPVLSDRTRLYFRTSPLSPLHMAQIPISGGQANLLPLAAPPARSYILNDLSPDGEELLVAAFAGAFAESAPFWALRIANGSSRRIGDIAGRLARYSPDGKRIAFTLGGYQLPGALWVASSDGSSPHRLVEFPGEAVASLCWSPDGSRIAFGRGPRATQQFSTWEIRADGFGLRSLAGGFKRTNLMPTGWMAGGSLLLNAAGQFWAWHPKGWYEVGESSPVQLTTGDPFFGSASRISRDGKFYAVGTTRLGELQRFDRPSNAWQPHLGGLSAENVDYSTDGRRLVYVTHPEGELWVRNSDGSHPVQLTRPPMLAGLARFSPDARTIAFAAKSTPDESWRIYLVNADGGAVRSACPEQCPAMDLAWAPDGKSLIFSGLSGQYVSSDPPFLQLLDLQSGTISRFPAADRFYSPRASRDWTAIAALHRPRPGSPSQIGIYRYSDGGWRNLPGPGPGDTDFPSWSHDNKTISYYDARRGAIMKCEVQTNRHVEVLRVNFAEMTGHIGGWFALTPNDEPMILRRRDIQQIYELRYTGRGK